ncbi:MAG: Holliday junction branch migration protein RuvA [Synechococcales cyanobacterium]
MIAFVQGSLSTVEPGERSAIVVEVHGIGYRVLVLPRALRELPPLGEPLKVFTHQVFRDPEWFLYGFLQAAERDLFVELIKVNGIGAALALALLNTLSLPELVQAIVAENVRVLTLTPGVGQKTAQRLALELKTKMASWRQQQGAPLPLGIGPSQTLREDVEMALIALGYRPEEIQRGFASVQVSEETVDAWLRAMIRYLS